MTARILLVEDNAINRQLAREVLSRRGHQVIEASSCEEARSRIRDTLVHLVLMDLQLGDGDGETLLQEMRADPELGRIPVIVVTASAMTGERERLLRAGFDHYLSKPIDVKTFGPTVEAFLKTGGAKAMRHQEPCS